MRAKPIELVNQEFGPQFARMVALGRLFWPHNVLPATGDAPIVYVELLTQDVRPAIRNLTIAKALARVTPVRIVALVGPERHWHDLVWQYYDRERVLDLAGGFCVDEIVDLDELRGQVEAGVTSLRVLGADLRVPSASDLTDDRTEQIGRATALRILRVPRENAEVRESAQYGRIVADAGIFARLYSAMFSAPTLAFITSHVDYHQWGTGVEIALARRIPVLHMQSTSALKAYAVFPETAERHPGLGFRGRLTLELGRIFEEQLWARRDLLRRSAELTAWRAKSNLGRPSWWRGGGAVSQQDFHTGAERASIRRSAMRRLGFNSDKPVVTVFAHAVSDAVGTNHEAFADLATWFEATVDFAATHPEVNWLFLDHPQQGHYDSTEHFESLGEAHSAPHMVFRPSMDLTRNVLWSLTDLAVTVRGSVSNEFPAYGIPAIQAGWSEWSHCGFTLRADTQDEYWSLLTRTIVTLLDGGEAITSEQIERARLWMWFYRAGADVVSPLVPAWDYGRDETLFSVIGHAYSHIDSDGDPAMRAVARLWARRSPVLTRFDFEADDAALALALAPVGGHSAPLVIDPDFDEPIATAMDRPQPTIELPSLITSGQSPDLLFTEGVARGVAIVGRASRPSATTAFKLPAVRGTVRIEVKLAKDSESDPWWRRSRTPGEPDVSDQAERGVEIHLQGERRGSVTFASGVQSRYIVTMDLDRADVERDGLLLLELDGARDALPDGVIGIGVDQISISEHDGPAKPVSFSAEHDDEYFADRNPQPEPLSDAQPGTLPPAEPAGERPARPFSLALRLLRRR